MHYCQKFSEKTISEKLKISGFFIIFRHCLCRKFLRRMHLYCVICSSKGVDWHIIDENWSCESLKSSLSRKNKSVKVHSCSFKNINFKNYGHFWDFAAENVWLDGFRSIFWIFSFFNFIKRKSKRYCQEPLY